MPRSSTRSRAVVVLGALALLAAACGNRTADSGSGGIEPTSAPATAGGGQGSSSFGSLPNPCGPASGTLSDGDQGVTASAITISTIADPGGVIPGLNKGVFETMDAFAAWCNGFGGINGRKLVVLKKDAQVVRYKDMVAEACKDSFALVGGIGALDQLGAADADACGLINVPAAAASPEQSLSPHTYQPLPNMPSIFNVGPTRWIKSQFPDAVTKAASLYSKLQTTEILSARFRQGSETQGYVFIVQDSANQVEPNWGPGVINMRNAGAEYMTITSTYEAVLPLQKEMAAQNWHPEVTELEANMYDQRYPQAAEEQGADTTNTFIRLQIWPFEDADENPAMVAYLDQLAKTVPDAAPAALGVQAWSAALLFATAAKAAGPNLTRGSLEDELKKITSWNGGGLHGHANPAARVPVRCFVVMKVDGAGFTRAYPLREKDANVYDNDDQKGMACPADDLVTLPGQPGADRYQAPS